MLAVLCATQVWAERTLTIDDVEEEDWNGIIDNDLGGKEIEITLSGDIPNTVELQGAGYIGSSKGSSATITVNGGEFTQSGGRMASSEGSSVTITVNGGEFTQSGGGIGGAYKGNATITVNKGGEFTQSGGSMGYGGRLDIIVNEGGIFTQSGSLTNGYIGSGSGNTITVKGQFVQKGGNIAGFNYDSVTITVDKDGEFTQEGGFIAYAYGANATIIVNGGKFTQKVGGIIAGTSSYGVTITVDKDGEFTQEGGYIAYAGEANNATIIVNDGKFTQEGGFIAYAGGTNATITVNDGGEFTSTGGHLGYSGSVTIDVKKGGNFSKSGGYISNGTMTVEEYGTFTLSGDATVSSGNTITVKGQFVQEGGTIKSYTSSVVSIGESGVYTMSGGTNGAAVTVNHGGSYVLSGSAEVTGEVTLKGGSLDLGNLQETDATIVFQDGTMSNAQNYAGTLKVETDEETTVGEALNMAGINGSKLKEFNVQSNKEGVSLINFAAGNTLTLSGENMMTLGSANAGEKGALFQFADGNGTLNFDTGATITFRNIGILKKEGECWLTNASTVTGWAEALRNNYELYGFEVSLQQEAGKGWKLTATGLDQLWIASVDGTEVNEGSNIGNYTNGVIADRDLTLTLTSLGATQVHNLTDGGIKGGFSVSGAGGVVVELVNSRDTTMKGDITVTGGAELRKTGTGTFTFSGTLSTDGELVIQEGSFTQSGGYIAKDKGFSATITVNDGGEFTSTGGYLGYDGSVTIDVKGGGNFSKSGGYIRNGTITVEKYGTFTLSGDATIAYGKTMTVNGDFVQEGGTINSYTSAEVIVGEGGVYTMSGGTNNATTTVKAGGNYNYSGGTIGASNFTVEDGGYFNLVKNENYTHSTALKGAGHITVNDRATYDLNGNKGTLDIIMRGGKLTNAGSYTHNARIDTGADYSGEVSLGGLNAARIESVTIAGAATSITEMAKGSTLSFHKGDSITVGSGHMSDAGGEARDGYILNFTDGSGTVAFAEEGAVVLNFGAGVFDDVMGKGNFRKEIWLTNGTIDGVPTEDIEGWLEEHFVLGAGLEDLSLTYIEGVNGGGKLLLYGNADGIWIASRNGQEVTSVTRLDKFNQVQADVDLTLNPGEEGTMHVRQLQSGGGTGDLIVESVEGLRVQLDNEHTDENGSNGNTDFLGNIRVEDGAGATAILEKTGSASLTVSGNVTTGGVVQVSEGTLALEGEGNSIGSLAMGGTDEEGNETSGTLQVDGTLTLTGRSVMTEESRGSIIGTGTVKMGRGASFTLERAVSYTVQKTELTGGAQMEQQGGEIKGGTFTLNGAGTGFTQMGGSMIRKASFTMGSGTTWTQSVGVIWDCSFTVNAGAKMEQRWSGEIQGGTFTLNGAGARLIQEVGGSITDGVFTLSGGATMTARGSIIGGVFTLSGGATMTARGSIIGGTFTLIGTSEDGAKLVLDGGRMTGRVTLEGAASSYDMGNQAAGGSVLMQGGKLENAGSYTGSLTIQTGGTYEGELKLGGVDAACITSITTEGSGTYLTGLKAGSTLTLSGENSMAVSTDNLNYEESNHTYLIQFEGGNGTIAFADGEDEGSVGFELKLDAKVIAALRKQEEGVELYFTNGDITGAPELIPGNEESQEAWKEWVKEHIHFTKTLESLGYAVVGIEGGKLLISGSTTDIYIAAIHGQTVTSPLQLGRYAAVVVDDDLTLDFDVDEEPAENSVIHNLLSGAGDETGDLIVNKSGEYALTLELNNTEDSELNSYRNFVGNLTVTVGKDAGELSLIKTGTEKLTVGGNLTTPGSLEVQEGTLELGGASSSVGSLEVKDGSGLVLSDKAKLHMGNDALTTGIISGPGELDWDGELSLSGTVGLDGVALDMEKGESLKIDGVTVSMGDGQIGGGESSVSIAVENNGSFTMEDGFLGSGKEDGATATLDVKGSEFVQAGGVIQQGAEVTLSDGATMEQNGGKIKDGVFSLTGAVFTQGTNGSISGGVFTLGGGATMSQSGSITGGTYTLSGKGTSFTQAAGSISGEELKFTLDDQATLTQNGGEISSGVFTLGGGATMSQGGAISGGTFTLNDAGTGFTQTGGTISEAASFTLNAGTMMWQEGGEIKGGTFRLSGAEANLTQAVGGSISGGTFTLSEGATMSQSGSITGGTFGLSGGTTMSQAGSISSGTFTLSGAGTNLTQEAGGIISGGTFTLSGAGTSIEQRGGTISGNAAFILNAGTTMTQDGGKITGGTFTLLGTSEDGAKLILEGGTMEGSVTMEGAASTYDMGNQAAGGSVLMKGGKLENAQNYAGTLTIQTDNEYTGDLELGGVDAARITKVVTGSSQTELHGLKSDSKLTFRDGESKMVVGSEHIAQGDESGTVMVQFEGGKGQIAFEEGGTLQLHLNSEVLKGIDGKGIEGQLEILFTNGSFRGLPDGQEKLEEWLAKHFVLETGMEEIKVLLLDDVHGGRLVLTGSTSGIWITSRNGQSVDVVDLLNRYSAVFVDEDLTLTLPATEEETPTIVKQLQNNEGEGDFIVQTEEGATGDTANHTVQLNNVHTNEHQNNGDTDFYGNINVEGEGLEAATLEKTGNATLTVHGDVTTGGVVRLSEGVLELEGEMNSIGSLAMGGTDEEGNETSGTLQVDGILTLTGRSVMTEESKGSITGEGELKMGKDASLTLAGEVSYTVQNTELTDGAQMKQQGKSSITGGSFTLSGTGTTFVQEGGSITGGSFTLKEGGTMETSGSITGGTYELSGEGTSLTQRAGSIGGGKDGGDAEITLKDGAKLVLSGGSMAGSVTMEGEASAYDMGSQEAGGSVLMKGGKLENAENYAGTLTIQTDNAYTGDLELGGVDAARITDVQTKGEVRLTQLKEESTLTLHGDHSMRVAVGNTDYGEQEAQALIEFNGAGGHVALEGNMTLLLDLSAEVLAGLRKQEDFELLFTNGDLVMADGKDPLTWVQEHFIFREVLEKLGFAVESVEGGSLIISGSTEDLYIVGEDGSVVDRAFQLGRYKGVIVDEDLALDLNVQENAVENSVLKNVESLGEQADLNIKKSGAGDITVELHNDEDTDTELGGNLTVTKEDTDGTGRADLLKSGKGKLTVGGKLQTEDNLTVADGTLALEGQRSSVGSLNLGSIDEEGNKTSGELQVDGTLTLTGNSDMSDDRGSITGGGKLVVEGDVRLGEEVQMDGPALELGSEGSVTASGELRLQGVNGQGSLSGRDVTVEGSGGRFAGTLAGSLTVEGRGAQQTLMGEVQGSEAELHVQDGGKLTLLGAGEARSEEEPIPPVGEQSYKSVENGYGGILRIEAASEEASGRGGAGIHVENDIVFRDDSTTELVFNMNSDQLWDEHDATMLETDKTIYIEDNAHFVLESLGEGFSSKRGDLVNVKVMQGSKVVLGAYPADEERVDTAGEEETGEPELYSAGAPEEEGLAGDDEAKSEGSMESEPAEEDSPEITRRLNVVELRGLFRVYFTGAWLGVDETTRTVYLNGKYRTASLFNGVANSHNSHAGANLLWEASQVVDLFVDGGVLSALSACVANTMESDPAEARRIMAAVAGSTVTSLSAAQRDVMRSRMQSVRNHAQAVSAPYESIEQKTRPYRVIPAKGWKDDAREEPTVTRRDVRGLHAWVEGVGHFHEQHTRGDESGYRLNAWGGAAGADLRLSEETVIGLSISALYGDLTANASDTAKGDWDSYTVSLWERTRDDRWAHTFVVSAGLNDAKLNRTVNYGVGSYTTHGKTDGYSLGALYELSYDVPLNTDSTRVLQPFATASVVHGVVNGYAESSRDRTGLNVGRQDLTLATLALGARWLMLTNASKALNRTIRTELRAAVAQDFGERRAKADVALQANPGYATGVYGSRTGSTALQFGGNLLIPVTENMDVTLDVNADLRAHSCNWNGSLGVRFGF